MFWEGLCLYRSTDTFVHCRLNEGKGWQSCIAMANLHQSTTASENLEDVSGEAPTVTAPEHKMPQATDLAVVSNASENYLFPKLLALECSHCTFRILMICVFQKPICHVKFLILSRSMFKITRRLWRKIQVQAVAVSFLSAKPRSVVVIINKTSNIWRIALMCTPLFF